MNTTEQVLNGIHKDCGLKLRLGGVAIADNIVTTPYYLALIRGSGKHENGFIPGKSWNVEVRTFLAHRDR